MKYAAVILAASLASTGAAQAQEDEPKPEVLETNEQGQPTKVKIGDREVYICNEERQDSCINPRDAGLNFGNRELEYWPGKPASEIDGPIPPTREQAVEQGLLDDGTEGEPAAVEAAE